MVSEESGSIGLAVGGSIDRDLTVEQLRERMTSLLRRYVPPTPLPTPIAEPSGLLDEREAETQARDLHKGGGER